jgi:hypothetical protein
LQQTTGWGPQLFEYNHNVRRIYTDGRARPSDLQATDSAQWMGHSSGRWEGYTLVIETVGFKNRTWLDRAGHFPRSHASSEGHTPLTFAKGHRAVPVDVNHVRWVSHCRDLVQLPVAG